MGSRARPYQFRIQPDPEKTLSDPGMIEFTITLTIPQLIGVKYMLAALFTSRYNHVSEIGQHFEYYDESSNHWLPPMIIGSNIVSYIPNYAHFRLLPRERNQSWIAAITNPDLVQFPPDHNGTVTKTYTMILFNYFNTTFGVVVQFDSLQILQGAISLCQWFGLNWRDWIREIHQDNQLMDVTNI